MIVAAVCIIYRACALSGAHYPADKQGYGLLILWDTEQNLYSSVGSVITFVPLCISPFKMKQNNFHS